MIEPIPTKPGTRDQLMSDLKTVVSDAESWLRNSNVLSGEDLKAAKDKFERTLINAKDTLVNLELVERTKVAARATDDYVQENPWKAVGMGAAVGVIVGMLIARK